MLEKPPSKVQFTAFKSFSTTNLRIGHRRLIPHRRFRARRLRPHFLSSLLKRGAAIQDAESCFRSDTRLRLAQLYEVKSYSFRLQSLSICGLFQFLFSALQCEGELRDEDRSFSGFQEIRDSRRCWDSVQPCGHVSGPVTVGHRSVRNP